MIHISYPDKTLSQTQVSGKKARVRLACCKFPDIKPGWAVGVWPDTKPGWAVGVWPGTKPGIAVEN